MSKKIVIPYCEVIVKKVCPAVRAIVTNKLISEYNLKEKEVAKLLNVSQPAISHYLHMKRGSALFDTLRKDHEIMKIVDKIVAIIYKGEDIKVIQGHFCEICKVVRNKPVYQEQIFG